MSIGERIKYIRNLRGKTQKYLGMQVGFDKLTADVRMAQYESGKRTPKEPLIDKLAGALDVNPKALTVPEIDTYLGLLHTLFAIEDIYGLEIGKIDGQICLKLNPRNNNPRTSQVITMLSDWYKEAEKLKNEDISKEEYDQWRYNFPDSYTGPHWTKVMPKQISDDIMKALDKEAKKQSKRKKKDE